MTSIDPAAADRRRRRVAALPAHLRARALVIDGAMGTMLQRLRLEEADFRGRRFADHGRDLKGANDLLVLTLPGAVRDVHAAYLAAGADIVSTNTFNANAVSLADYGLEPYAAELNRAAAALARSVAEDRKSTRLNSSH